MLFIFFKVGDGERKSVSRVNLSKILKVTLATNYKERILPTFSLPYLGKEVG